MENLDYLNFKANFSNAEAASLYDEVPLWSAIFGLVLLQQIPVARNLQVLDVGCGTGFPLLELAQRLGNSCTVWGIDPWEAALKRAKDKARTRGILNVHMKQEKAEEMSFPNAAFDLIVSNLGINNFRDPTAAVTQCFRVCKPTGKLALTTNLRGHMAEFYAVFEETLRELGLVVALESLRTHIDHRATVQGLRALLGSCGFRVSRVVEEATVMRFVDGSSLLRHHFIKIGFLDGWKSVVPSDQQEKVFTLIEKKLNESTRQQGELRLSIPIAYIEAERQGA